MEYATLVKLALINFSIMKGNPLSQYPETQEPKSLAVEQQLQKSAAPKSSKGNISNNNNKKNRKKDPWAWKKVPPQDGKAH
eukprot:12967146-Ditylum_brightwellii.AAC.1